MAVDSQSKILDIAAQTVKIMEDLKGQRGKQIKTKSILRVSLKKFRIGFQVQKMCQI